MFLRKLLSFFTIILLHFSNAQKPKTDTVYVYEKVIVYDTVYLEKSLKLKPGTVSFSHLNIQEKEIRNIVRENIAENKTNSNRQNQSATSFQYGIETGAGLKKSSWAKELSDQKQQFGENIGAWVSKNIFASPLSVMLSANVYYWNSTFDLDANKEDTFLNGFYFSKDHQPLLFQKFNNKHFEYALQLKLLYEWKNIRPFVGFLANKNIYKMQFLVPENDVLNKLDDFKTHQINFGFSLGLQYRFFKRFLLSFDYQYCKMKNVSLKNPSFDFDIFETNNTFAERKTNLGISYIISK
ncbi:hypothetical protein HNP38_001279 [Chryseobacterium defluvii]|uniref:Outer membrane protein with beta-barrel domain n=1 Tax=Chryseobacterium defluvii TaxID=160396 RepID=A0A840KDD2_9FLAO|nr:hypothetical protein [Chryseobacterium defluvii]MBB4806007.1 hypothetical protein [Chryseobacterium defluvii]